MTVTEFLDSKLDKDTDDIIFIDLNGNTINITDYNQCKVHSHKYIKVVCISVLHIDSTNV